MSSAIPAAFGHAALVLGAWGCGAFRNDPQCTARDLRQALEEAYSGVFSDVVFAVTDWSPERRSLGPFRGGDSRDRGRSEDDEIIEWITQHCACDGIHFTTIYDLVSLLDLRDPQQCGYARVMLTCANAIRRDTSLYWMV